MRPKSVRVTPVSRASLRHSRCIAARPDSASKYRAMKSAASSLLIPSCCARPNGVCPYTIPKFTAFARSRCSGVTDVDGQPENFGGRPPMNVFARRERLRQRRIAGKMRHDPQLHLRIVRGDKPPARLRHKCPADFSSQIGADRNVLQVRIAAGKPAGCGSRLIERRMQPAVCRIDQLRE